MTSAALAALIACLAQGPVLADGEATGPLVRVLVASGRTVTASAAGGSRVVDAGGRVVAPGTSVVFEASGDGVRIVAAGKTSTVPEATLCPPEAQDWVMVGSTRYRGSLQVVPASDGTIMALNVLPLETYLYGVVPCEIPPGWPAEALKAQAVAARSYAVSCCRQAGAKGAPYDLQLNVDGQVYGGLDREDPRTSAAVDETSGVVLTYAGEPVSAVFHSSSGGHTENSEYVWSAKVPYLRGVEDPADDSPHRSWEFRVTSAEMEHLLDQAGCGVGRLLGIDGVEQGVSGRWSTIAVKGVTREITLRGSEFRRITGLKSTLFTVIQEEASVQEVVSYLGGGQAWAITASGDTVEVRRKAAVEGRPVISWQSVPAGFVFRGSGYGHGAGLSQWGARGLALQGYKYEDILRHYYTDTRLELLSGTPAQKAGS